MPILRRLIQPALRFVDNCRHKSGMSSKEKVKPTWALTNKKGEFIRNVTTFRSKVTADGSSGFKAESGRYHLYVSLACPWAHRTLTARKLKGLEDCISISVVHWFLGEKGWTFAEEDEKIDGCIPDYVNNCKTLRQVYQIADPKYDGRVTVPVLWDKQKKMIVNNESAEIVRMLGAEFNEFCKTAQQRAFNMYPENLQAEIDALNDWIYPSLNNGVYKAGFATSQEAYNNAVISVFEGLEKVEKILSTKRYLTGNQITEADVRLFTTLIRFDHVYHGHFKCNKKRLIDYPNIWGYTRDINSMGCIKETINFEHIRKHYMVSHKMINPFLIVSIAPDLDFDEPHGREKLG